MIYKQCYQSYYYVYCSKNWQLVYMQHKKQQYLKQMIEQRSYYLGQTNQDNDYSYARRDACITLSDISKQLTKYHTQIIQKLDNQDKLQQMQKKLTKLIMERFENLTRRIQEIDSKLVIETVVNSRDYKSVNETPQVKQRNDIIGNSQEIKNSVIYNIYGQFQNQDSSQEQNIYQNRYQDTGSYFTIPLDDEVDNKFDPSSLLQQLANTFAEMNLKFTKCDLVYEFPFMKYTDFHKKIDNKNNIFFLAQLDNHQFIGAFSNLCFDPNPIYIPKENSKSFICNLNRNIYAYAYRVNKTHTHDPNFLIFGNWEIKVKNGEDILETNWGTNGDCFSLKKYGSKQVHRMNVKELFGQGAQSKKLKIKKYNFYVFS